MAATRINDTAPSLLVLLRMSGCYCKAMQYVSALANVHRRYPTLWFSQLWMLNTQQLSSNSLPATYCLICFGKILERLVKEQLIVHLNKHFPLQNAQHGFIMGRSTITNSAACDLLIADCISLGHPYDIITIDLQKAFDKIPHSSIIEALSCTGITGSALAWFASFLSNRTQQVRIGGKTSEKVSVISGSVQGSVLGPDLFSVVIDSLLGLLEIPAFGFADDIKFVIDCITCTTAYMQVELDKVEARSIQHAMPLSLDKSVILHSGLRNPCYQYKLQGDILKCSDTVRDLGTLRCTSGNYNRHIAKVAIKASRLSGAIMRVFHGSSIEMLMLAFNNYVLPILMYASPIWNLTTVREKVILENILRRFTKRLLGFRSLSYEERLLNTSVMSLEDKRFYADLVFTFKCIHNLSGCSLDDIGLSLVEGRTRDAGVRLSQRHHRTVKAAA